MKIEIPDNIANWMFAFIYIEICAIICTLLGWGIGELLIKITG